MGTDVGHSLAQERRKYRGTTGVDVGPAERHVRACGPEMHRHCEQQKNKGAE